MPTKTLGARAGCMAVALALAAACLPQQSSGQDAYRVAPASPEVDVGDGVRVAIRIDGPSGIVTLSPDAVSAARIDMGPDGMAAMAAPLRPVAPRESESLAWETDLVMAGRWALTVTAAVPGEPEPVSGAVIFTAVDAGGDEASARDDSGACEVLYYRNPMGLPDVSETPKKDSMGMDYIPVCEDEVGGPEGTVRIGLDRVQRAGVEIAPVERRTLTRSILGAAEITANEDAIAHVTAKYAGFVEGHDLPVTGDVVAAGQPMARVWIESPELLQKQADYLTALRRGGPDAERAAENLRLFDFPDDAIATLEATMTPVRTIGLLAPIDGVVTQRMAAHGFGFEPGDMLFEITDLRAVWAMAAFAEQDVALLRAGQPVTLSFSGVAEPVAARIDFVYPTLDRSTRTGMARIVLDNAEGRLRPGMYAEARVQVDAAPEPAVAIPRSAIIDDGSRQVAFVAKDGGLFEPRNLTLGARGDAYVEVREGLAEGERIVVAGAFLIDAESNLQSALNAFMSAGDAP
jgi:Cu(I)/Ag(I) efflux system membrane fusion protein